MSSSVTSSATSSATSAASGAISAGSNLKVVGIILAIASGVLIGSSFVFKKKGLLRSQAGGAAGEGVAYLKSPLWWFGMTLMILGELCNFAAYAFVEAIVVTPLGALSVVICAILSSLFLNEKLSFFGWLGCALCILGSVIIALNGPKEGTIGQIKEFQKLFLAPGFLAFISVLIVSSLVIVFYFAPKYGKRSMLWYIFVCSMIGGISVSVTTGLGAAIVTTAKGDNQFKFWFMYFLFAFVVITLLVEIYYLNIALALFNTAMVTPTYYVIFTFFSMLTTIVLFQGLKASATQIITLVMGFLVICLGITILQMSKVDPEKLGKLDRRSTMLLQAAREQTTTIDEKGAIGYEDPGMDTLRGSFGAVGSIIRARTVRRMSQMSHSGGSQLRMRPPGAAAPYDATVSWMSAAGMETGPGGMTRHQLYDAPVPRDDTSSYRAGSIHSQVPVHTAAASQLVNKRPTIKFDSQEIVHSYSRPGGPASPATHEHRQAIHGSMIVHDGYPPLPPLPDRSSSAVSVTTPRASAVATDGGEDLLVQMDSPEIPKNPRMAQKEPLLPAADEDVTLELPPLLKKEHIVQSAPPNMYRAFARSPPPNSSTSRKDSRDLFSTTTTSDDTLRPPNANANSSTRGTLLSFPSVTDSAPSQWDDDEIEEDERQQKRNSRLSPNPPGHGKKKDKSRSREREREKPRTPKKYPKGLEEDDLEESESLWHRATSSLESSEEAMLGGGSIRLVPSNTSGPKI
ncbi:hypothetical protein D9613_000094 [Agrocybe pediades]|uniref:DUF803-domain-containing protein n=1 Tax=Agrocybe pediades TaxID=84607 RepID=A0A8H4R0Q6_9AGAR|nr:hypothetical protein D9613_000094 [Agrocybe pediades]